LCIILATSLFGCAQAEQLPVKTYHLLANHDGVVYWLLRMQTSCVTQNRTDLRKSLPGLGQFWSEMLDVKIEGETPIEVNGLHGLSTGSNAVL
jgi:hypothetical protein